MSQFTWNEQVNRSSHVPCPVTSRTPRWRHVFWKAAGGGVLLAWTSYLLASSPKPSAASVGEAVNGSIVWGILAVLAFHALLTWLQFR